MQITETIVKNLIMLLDKHGLIHGAGETSTQFCIQQAVNRVINDDLYGQYSDKPTWDCLNAEIRSLGVRMNDCARNMDDMERAVALKRFAVAELGSSKIDSKQFLTSLHAKLGMDDEMPELLEDIVDGYIHNGPDGDLSGFKRLKKLADTAAEVLQEMGSEGSQFLHLLDESNKKKQVREACKLGDKMYAAQMADFGNSSCAVKPKQQQ